MYSSGGQFQLELPSGTNEGPKNLWEIPAFALKPIIRIKFHGNTPGHHSAYIRIKISGFDPGDPSLEDVLIVPVEFQILQEYGLYTEGPILNFGRILRDELKVLKLNFTKLRRFVSRVYKLSFRKHLQTHHQTVGRQSYGRTERV